MAVLRERIPGRQVRTRAVSQTRIHLTLLAVWLLLGIPTLLFWSESLIWIVLMSWYAIVASHWSAWEASRAEEAAE